MTYNKEKAQIYRNEHKEKMKEYNKKYYNNNKNQIIKKLTQKTPCNLCGRVVSSCRLNQHQETKFCENNRNKANETQNLKLLLNYIIDNKLNIILNSPASSEI